MPHSPDLLEQVRAATALLESLAGDRAQLLGIDETERNRLLHAAGEVSRPDAILRRQLVKATKRLKKSERRERIAEAETQLNSTGIRSLRRQTVFTTPNYLSPGSDDQETIDDPDFCELLEPQHCYVCKQKFEVLHHFYE